jgi:NADPH-dependent curcumin reductase CurA
LDRVNLLENRSDKTLETVVEVFDQLPTAMNMLFDSKNVGKLGVDVRE